MGSAPWVLMTLPLGKSCRLHFQHFFSLLNAASAFAFKIQNHFVMKHKKFYCVIWASFSTLNVKPSKLSIHSGSKATPNLTELTLLHTVCGGINKRLLLINQTATRRLFRWRGVYTVCNTGTDLEWSGFCSSLDMLIKEETRLQNPLLYCCGNVPLAAKMKCVVLIWRLVVKVMKAHTKPCCVIWHPFRKLW